MPKIKINNKDIEFDEGMTVLQACEQAGKEIPRFCYHSRLSIAGNCRMCLVELEKAPKPIATTIVGITNGNVVSDFNNSLHGNSYLAKTNATGNPMMSVNIVEIEACQSVNQILSR